MIQWASRTRLTPEQQIALAVRILDNRHLSDVYDRIIAMMPKRGRSLGPIDLSRNSLRTGTDRLNRAHEVPPAVDGLTAEMANLLGDYSSTATIAKYATIGARPMPTTMQMQSRAVGRYRIGATFAGHMIGWSARASKVYTSPIAPDSLRLIYASDDPTEPTVIQHVRTREIGGKVIETTDTYDLTDLDLPRFSSQAGTQGRGRDLTGAVLDGGDVIGNNWPAIWTDADGRPFHRIIISGNPDKPFETMSPIEATLNVAMYWTAWGAGIIDAGHPQRNVRNLMLAAADSDSETGEVGVESGPETVIQWTDMFPDKAGEHWQDGPGFDPEANGRAVRSYEVAAMNGLGLPIDYERTGGEPTAQEQEAVNRAVADTYPECRRSDGLVLARCAAMLNRIALPNMPTFSEEPYRVAYREEIHSAIEAITGTDSTPNQ